jgi:hypothetical protein
MKKALDEVTEYRGIAGTYTFSPTQHEGVSVNPLKMVRLNNGKVKWAP